MMIDDALGVAGGARRVVQRDCIPLVLRHQPIKFRITLGDKTFILYRAQQFAGLWEFQIIVIYDEGFYLG